MASRAPPDVYLPTLQSSTTDKEPKGLRGHVSIQHGTGDRAGCVFLEMDPQETQAMDVGDRQDADEREACGFLIPLPHGSDLVTSQAQVVRLGGRRLCPRSHLTGLWSWLSGKPFVFPICNDISCRSRRP